MGGKPKTIYSDNEGSFHSKLFTKYFSNNDIRFLSTNTHAAYVERLIRSIKAYIDKRVERYKKPWLNYLKMALNYYNNSHTHATTKLTPKEATKKENYLTVKLNLLANKKHDRQYPEIKIGDRVRIYKKKDLKHKKEAHSVWSKNTYEVEDIINSLGQKLFKLSGTSNYNKNSFLRHELLLIDTKED